MDYEESAIFNTSTKRRLLIHFLTSDAYLYYYAPGQTVDRFGGGVKIPLPSQFGE